MLMIRGQDKWLNSNVRDVCFLLQDPQGSRQRRQPSVTRACDGQTERTQGQQQGSLTMSRTAVNPASVEMVIASIFGRISLSAAWGVNGAAAHGQKQTLICLATI